MSNHIAVCDLMAQSSNERDVATNAFLAIVAREKRVPADCTDAELRSAVFEMSLLACDALAALGGK